LHLSLSFAAGNGAALHLPAASSGNNDQGERYVDVENYDFVSEFAGNARKKKGEMLGKGYFSFSNAI
jgi:hypothetical protein